jgi:hypothetical protein
MRVVLHILTKPDDEIAREIIVRQSADPGLQVAVADLTSPAPDYVKLIEGIFAAESVAVW